MLDEKSKEEEELLKYHFRAKDVPQHVKEPLYEKIMKANEARR